MGKSKKKTIEEESKEWEEIGLEESDRKAVKLVVEKNKESEKEFDQEEAVVKEILEQKKTKASYKEYLAQKLRDLLVDVEWPVGYDYLVRATDKGVVVAFRTAGGRHFAKGFTVSGDVEIDLNAVYLRYRSIEDKVDQLEGRAEGWIKGGLRKTLSGIILPGNTKV